MLGLLYGAQPDWKEQINAATGSYLQGTPGMLLQSASFLQGLFYTARDLLLAAPDFLPQIDPRSRAGRWREKESRPVT